MINAALAASLVLSLLSGAQGFVAPRYAGGRTLVALEAKAKGFQRDSVSEQEDAEAGQTMELPLGEESRRDRQGRELLDVLTQEPVRFPSEPEERYAALWKEPSAEDVGKLRMERGTDGATRLAKLGDVVDKEDPEALRAFVNANLHLYGVLAARALSAVKLKAQSEGDKEEALRCLTLRRKVMAAEASLVTVFHVDLLDRQSGLGEVLGRTDVKNFVGSTPAEILPTWVVIKAMTSAWEDKYATDTMDAQVAMDKRASVGEPKKLRIAEQKAIARSQSTMLAMQSMAAAFRGEADLIAALPLCCQFLDAIEAENVPAAQLPAYAEKFVGDGTFEDLVIALQRLQVRLDTNRLPRSFRLYSWYVRNVVEALRPEEDQWAKVEAARGDVVPYRITDGFSWQRSASVPTRNWVALEQNLEQLSTGRGGNPEYGGYGDASRDDDVSVLGVLGRAINPFQRMQDDRAQAANRGLEPGVNPDPMDDVLPFGGDWLFLLDDAPAEIPRDPQLSQEELDDMIKDYDPESELRAKSREGENEADLAAASPPPEV